MKSILACIVILTVVTASFGEEVTSFSGELFITTKGQSIVKLGGVLMQLYPESELARVNDRLKVQEQHYVLSNETLQAEIDQIDAANVKLLPLIKRFKITLEKLNTLVLETEHNKYDTRAVFESIQSLQEKQKQIESAMTDNGKTLELLKTNMGVKLLFRDPVGETRSDAEGKFSFTAPGNNFIIVAESERSLFSGSEHYIWVVPIEGKSAQKAKVILSNHNLLNEKPISRDNRLNLPHFEPSNAAYLDN